MPKMSGVQVVEKTTQLYKEVSEEQDRKIELPIFVVVSTYVAVDSFRRYLEQLGVKYFFRKPVPTSQLKVLLTAIANAAN